MQKEIVVSGIRPTGFLHLGNYFGAMQNYVRMQEEYDCFFFVADWHSLTTHPDTKELRESVLRVLAENIAAGLDPEKVCLYVQSAVPEIAELYLLLNMLAYMGELEKTPTFKDKARLQPDNVNVGLLTYPVLQAADILIHKATYVPVGKDQEQHLEMARKIAQRFNYRYGELFPEPQPFNFGKDLVKVPSLDGSGKMSKSENQLATLYLVDSDEVIRKKLMKAKTDPGTGGSIEEMPESVKNLFQLMSLVSAEDKMSKYLQDYKNSEIRYGDMKKELGEDMVRFITPIRERAVAIYADKDQLKKIMAKGAEQARESAQKTIREVRSLMALDYLNKNSDN
jgi:tryptophanyl-tRNA synthetase